MPTTPAKSKAERTFDRLVSATMAEINTTGSFTGERVAKRAAVSPATFYLRFSSKEAALNAAFEATIEQLVDLVITYWDVEQLLEQGLNQHCEQAAQATVRYFREHALMFRHALAELPNSKAIRDTYRRGEDKTLQQFHQFIALGQRAGFIRTGDPGVMARTHLVLTQGLNNPNALTSEERQSVTEAYAHLMRAHLTP